MNLHRDDIEAVHEEPGIHSHGDGVIFLGVGESGECVGFVGHSAFGQVVAQHLDAIYINDGSIITHQIERDRCVLRRIADVDVRAEVSGHELVFIVRAEAHAGRFITITVAELRGAERPVTVVVTRF